MAWKTQFEKAALKQLKKIDKKQQQRIVAFLSKAQILEDPRSDGKALTGQYKGLWRYRVGMYRIICELKDDVAIILVIEAGHRGEIYR